MKTIGNLLLTISLIGAMLSAATAYLAPLSLPDEAFQTTADGDIEHARLASPAGRELQTDAEREALRSKYAAGEITAEAYTAQLHSFDPALKAAPTEADLAPPDPGVESAPVAAAGYTTDDADGTRLTPERMAQLRDASERIAEAQGDGARAGGAAHVKSFAFDRWPYWWVFALSAVGLFAGSMLVRAGTKAEIAAAATTSPGSGAAPAASPEQSLQGIIDIVASLRRDLPGMADDEARNDAIIERLDTAQKTHIVAFIDARPLLVNRFGLGGYAELMDRFAAAERQINRAWSAAADGVYHEAANSLDTAADLLEETRPKLNSA